MGFSIEPNATTPRPTEEVHVWRIDLLERSDLDHRRALLSSDEMRSADRFHFPRDRDRYIAGRAAMRSILSHYAGERPDRLVIETSAFGKPRLAGGSGIEFNLSHSGDLALLAVASGRPVGIDVEMVRPIPDVEAIASRFFSEAERCAIEESSAERKAELFFRTWTRKEAFLKALGVGMNEPLETIDVGTGTTPMMRISCGSTWTLVDLDSGPEQRSALAVRGEGCAVKNRDFRARDYS